MSDAGLDELLRALVRRGFPEVEVLVKRGRSRRLVLEAGTAQSIVTHERAWAVRASDRRASFVAGGTGDPPDCAGPGSGGSGRAGTSGSGGGRGGASTGGAAADWPEPSGRPFRLPEPVAAPAWKEPSDFAAPLLGESDGWKLLERIGEELAGELPGARLVHAALEDGSSEADLASSRGLAVRSRRRLATLRLEAAGPRRAGGGPAATAALYLAARAAHDFQPPALARRLADRLAVTASGAPPPAGSGAGDMLLAPPVAAALLAGLLPLFVGPAAAALLAPHRDRRGHVGSERLTVIDNGRLPGGAMECQFDGEGMPCREAVLIEAGAFRQPLLAWWQAGGSAPGIATGCTRRPGWRDLPTPGPTHLYLRPDPKVSVGALLGEVAQGAYLIEATGFARYDPVTDRFTLPVCGFHLQSGRATAPIAAAHLTGTATAFFKGLAGVARDLSFLPLDGLIGAPTLLVRGLDLRPVS